jgi:citronellyl-CoA synthetase
MANSSFSENQLISLSQYLNAQLRMLPRFPVVMRNIRRIRKIDEENSESWGSLLEETTQRFPDNVAVKSEEAFLTYREYNESVNRYAHYFISQGIKKGDVISIFLETRPELLIIYSALAKIGAVNCMINTNLRADSLRHCLTLNPAAGLIVGEELLDAFSEVQPDLKLPDISRHYFVTDQAKRTVPQGFIELHDVVNKFPMTNPPTRAEVKPADTIAYVFTSGTTGGMPKAAVLTHKRVVSAMYFTGKTVMDVQPTDTIYVPLPFFHTNALALSWPCVFANGAAVAVRRRFSASRFWDDIRKYNATIFCYVGECCRYLMNQPPKSSERGHSLTTIIGNGLRPDIWMDFKRRFGITRVFEIYGAAESNLFFINMLNFDYTVGTCFMPFAIVKYDIDADEPVRDKNGGMEKVKKGQVGLLLGKITDFAPFEGYTSKEATEAKIFRNVFEKEDAWFNTGDLVRDIGFKHIQFVDRLGDTFRWKGENVSTTEVEKVADVFPQISMSMAYGVSMPGSDGRAGMLAIIPRADIENFDFERLAEHFRTALPDYAIPKFLRFKKEFEYTPTHKIKKVDAKKEGFDIGRSTDPMFILLPGSEAYQPLTDELYGRILAGTYKF